ncbi:MAG: hypothetical protein ACLVCL_03335 [Parvimonas micra]
MKKVYNKPDSEEIKALCREYLKNPTPELRDKIKQLEERING